MNIFKLVHINGIKSDNSRSIFQLKLDDLCGKTKGKQITKIFWVDTNSGELMKSQQCFLSIGSNEVKYTDIPTTLDRDTKMHEGPLTKERFRDKNYD